MVIRMGGLGTGNDTAKMIEAILEAERIPVTRLQDDIAQEEEKLAAWNDLDTSFDSLYTKTHDLTSYLTWQQKNASSDDSTIATASATGSAVTAAYAVDVTQLAKAHRIASDSQASADTALGLTGDFVLNGETVTVASTDSLEDIRDSINSASLDMTDKVTATIIDTTLVIERQNTGTTSMTMTDGTNNIGQTLGILSAPTTFQNVKQVPLGLSVDINSVTVTREANTGLTDIVDGITFNFKAEDTTTLTIERDTASIKSAFEDFVESYNDAMEIIEENTKVVLGSSEASVSSTGVLQGDPVVSSIAIKTRALITSSGQPDLPPPFDTLQSIGIWTEGQSNRLAIVDEERLDDVLENNFEEVEDLIRDFDGGRFQEFDNFLDSVRSPIDGTISRRLESLESSIDAKEDKILDLEFFLLNKETELWEHFSVMESTVASISSQTQFLLKQFS